MTKKQILQKVALDNPFLKKMNDWILKKRNVQLPKPQLKLKSN